MEPSKEKQIFETMPVSKAIFTLILRNSRLTSDVFDEFDLADVWLNVGAALHGICRKYVSDPYVWKGEGKHCITTDRT